MSTKEGKYKWLQLQNIFNATSTIDTDDKRCGSPLYINNHEIIMSIGTYRKISSFIKYNALKDEASQFLKLTNDLQYQPNSCAIDDSREMVLVPTKEGIHKIILKSGAVDNIKTKNPTECGWQYPVTSIITGDILRTFGAWDDDDDGSDYEDYNTHTMYNIQTNELQTKDASLPNGATFWEHAMIYIESKEKLLFFGAESDQEIYLEEVR